jgi:hypothetical protein
MGAWADLISDIERNAGEAKEYAQDNMSRSMEAGSDAYGQLKRQMGHGTPTEKFIDGTKEVANELMGTPDEKVIKFQFGGQEYQIEGNEKFDALIKKLEEFKK